MPTDASPVQTQTHALKRASTRFFIIVSIVAILIGVGLAMTRIPSVFVEGDVHPLSNDAFYHTTRILRILEGMTALDEELPLSAQSPLRTGGDDLTIFW